ncbi:MAG: hypothetical protein UH625_06215 [Muribaculaceae bacterium]|nr:hypothetical protein [Muribaculaceae bacterium]
MINIDGFEFEATCSDVSDVENLNYFLEDKFNKFDVKNFMSRLHPELFPNHVGLLSDDNLMLRVVLWGKSCISPEGERDDSWHGSALENSAKYIADILGFYERNEPVFFNFIKNRIIR